MSVYKRGNVWWISYYYNGERIREGISGNRREAEAAHEARKTDVRRGEYRHIAKRERVTFEDMVAEYKAEKAGKRSLRQDEIILKKLLPAFRFKYLDQITAQDIEAYKKKRADEVSGATVNRGLALLKCLFNVAIQKNHVSRNPVKGIKFFPEMPRKGDRVFSSLEIEHLIEAAAPHLRPILAVALFTGLRKGDILALRPEDVDFKNRVIRVLMQKTAEPVEIPMHPILERTLRAAMSSPAPYVFMSTRPSRRTGEITKLSNIKNGFHGAIERSGLAGRGYCFHDIRRTFASMLYRSSVPLLTVSKLLGHRSVKTTERYLGVKLEEKRLAVAALGSEWGSALMQPERTGTISAQLPETTAATRLLSDGSGDKSLPS